jgi:hypothetical protein
VNDVFCIAHCINLAIQTVDGLRLVGKIENPLASMYHYFAHNLKPHLEIYKLVELLKCNIKTQWMSMLSPSKRMLNEYQMLVVKMVEDNVSIVIVKTNHELLYDVETLLGLAFVLPLLELVQGLFKFA